MAITKLGILVVYYLDESESAVLSLHLDAIAAHTASSYTIYAAANRLSPAFRSVLERTPNLRICHIPPTELRSSREHAYYLDQLAEQAIADGCSHLCTFDVDSFPIQRGWDTQLAERLTERSPVAAVLRRENGDKVLVHPCCAFFNRGFWETYRPRFLPTWRECRDWAGRFFLARHLIEGDTGIGISYALHKHGLGWHKMLRSNAAEDHYLIGGIYDDLIFHLGASTRGTKQFRGDERFVALPIMIRLRLSLGRYIPIRPLKRLVTRGALETRDRLLAPMQAENQRAFDKVRAELLAAPERYFARLRGATGRVEGSPPPCPASSVRAG